MEIGDSPGEDSNDDTPEGLDASGQQDDSTYIPPDKPSGVGSYGTTASEQLLGESLEQRDRRLLPEVGEQATYGESDPSAGRLLQTQDLDVDMTDVDEEELAVETGSTVDLSAEEEAVRVVKG